MLEDKSLHDLRAIAQGYGITDIFSKTDIQLRQEISLKQDEMQPKPEIVISKPEYDARLMTRPPAKKSDKELAEEFLAPYVARGLHVTFTDEEWFMKHGKREDSGTIRMPIRVLLTCAERMLRD